MFNFESVAGLTFCEPCKLVFGVGALPCKEQRIWLHFTRTAETMTGYRTQVHLRARGTVMRSRLVRVLIVVQWLVSSVTNVYAINIRRRGGRNA